MRKIIFSLALLFVLPALSTGHVYIMESYPTENAVLNESPEKVTLTFLGSVEPMFSKIEVFDKDGKKVSEKTACREDDTIMEVALIEKLPPGTYTVKWKCMSLDGHKQTGEYTFKIE